MGSAELRRQVEYRSALRGGENILARRFYPTSKTCSDCGHVLDDLPLPVREGTRAAFGAFPDYVNADAVASLKNLAVTSMVSACGEEGHGARRKVRVKQASVKQGVRFIQL